MLDLLFLSLQVRFTLSANRLIHFLRRIPGIRKALPPELYGNYTLKLGFALAGALLIAFSKALSKLLYAAFLTAFGMLLYQAAANGGFAGFFAAEQPWKPMDAPGVVGYILTAWFFLSFVGAAFGAVVIGSSGHERDKIMVQQLRTNPALYARTRIVLLIALDCLLYLPLLIAALAAGGIALWKLPVILLVYTGFRLCGEAVNLLVFRYTGRHFGRMPFVWATIPLFVAAAAIPLYAGALDWAGIQLYLLLPSAVAAGVLAWRYIIKYARFAELLREKITRTEAVKLRQSKREQKSNFGDANQWSKNVTQTNIQSEKHEGKSGFFYLNAIFFDRHSLYFKRKMQRRSLFILAPLLLAAVFTLFYAAITGDRLSELIDYDQRTLFNYAPIFFFIIYIASMGRVVTASVFSNCDIHMLHYPYYRTKETILASFKARVAVILRLNAVIALWIALSTLSTVWLLFGYLEWRQAGVFIFLMLCMGAFFAFNDLFLYYVLQPYDTAGQSKSTAYKVINGVIYAIAYMNLRSEFDFAIYSMVIPAATILYIGIGSLLLLAVAPKQFKLR